MFCLRMERAPGHECRDSIALLPVCLSARHREPHHRGAAGRPAAEAGEAGGVWVAPARGRECEVTCAGYF